MKLSISKNKIEINDIQRSTIFGNLINNEENGGKTLENENNKNKNEINKEINKEIKEKKRNKLTFKMIFGLGMATVGAVFITSHSFWNNLKCNKKKDEMKKVDIKENEVKV